MADFPHLNLSLLFVQASFLQAESAEIDNLDTITAMMGRHVVTRQHVMKACLRNDCVSVVPIQYALRFVKGFDVKDFMNEIVEVLLDQPYRGTFLR